jgi:hypothetical protein
VKPNRHRIAVFVCHLSWLSLSLLLIASSANATPANRAALGKHFDQFLPKNLNKCTTCHLPSDNKNPETLEQFPHNPFGSRLLAVGKELAVDGKKKDIPERLTLVAEEDSDGDGVANLNELLLGHSPGNATAKPSDKELAEAKKRRSEFQKYLAGYRWQPFNTVNRPAIPPVKNKKWVRNPIDAFIAAEHDNRKLKPQPEASKSVLLRRIYMDLIGLSPTPEQLTAFENDKSANAYEKVVDQLLADPRYGERWGRHWMDVWRYSDWAGYNAEVRDSKPHVWRWRDWIVESLNEDKPYDGMVLEMLAADELYPENTNALRATGFLVRNYKLLSREQWITDTIHHTSKAFMGITMNCAKCHDHMYDPISQAEYFKFRAIFEPHFVRTDRVPGQYDIGTDGLVRVYDVDTNPPTYIFHRGDDRNPNTNNVIAADVPAVFGGSFAVESVKLPRFASFPDKREFAEQGAIVFAEKAIPPARDALQKVKGDTNSTPKQIADAELKFAIAEAHQTSLLATLKAEHFADAGKTNTEDWTNAATSAVIAQRKLAVFNAKQALDQARDKQQTLQSSLDQKVKAAEEMEKAGKDPNDVAVAKLSIVKVSDDLQKAKTKREEAEKTLADAEKENTALPNTAYKPSSSEIYPTMSTGRRSAFARWLTDVKNPLTARVVMNHIWLRHFDRAIVATTSDFGLNGCPPTHPQLLDWLAAEFMEPAVGNSGKAKPHPWSMKHIHRLIVTSSAYRMAATFNEKNAAIDPQNTWLWRMPSKRLEAEAIRDNLLYVGGNLDSTFGGPEIPAAQGLTSKRRSIYLRIAQEKEVPFLKIFDGPDPVECYARRPSVMPHQALALANSELAFAQSRLLASNLVQRCGEDAKAFVSEAFLKVLSRKPNRKELTECTEFLAEQTAWIASKRASASGVTNASVTVSQNAPSPSLPEPAKRGGSNPVSAKTSVTAQSTNAAATEPPKTDKSKAASPGKITPPGQRAREDLVLVLFNHNDFVTIR